jgi:hypothetical protein
MERGKSTMFTDHSPNPAQPPALGGLKQFLSSIHTAFPDHHVNVEGLAAAQERPQGVIMKGGLSSTPEVRQNFTSRQLADCLEDFEAHGPSLYLGDVAAALYTFSGEADGLLVLCKEGVIEVVTTGELVAEND